MATGAKAQDWTRITPEEAGFAPDMEKRLDRLIADRRATNLHGVVVVRNGQLVLERYFTGNDNSRGRPLGQVRFGPDTLHDLRSVSKSIVGLLYGAALARGKVPPPETKLAELFPQYGELWQDSQRARWTVHHVLTMTLGTEWDELSIPYTDPNNSEIAMDRAADRFRYVLDRPLVFHPGSRWVYNGGCTAILGKLIADGTKQSLHAFAQEALFGPLGIERSEWLKDGTGREFAASGLRLTPRDLARIGQMMLEKGEGVGGAAVVPNDWIRRATAEIAVCDETRRYGYQWYSGYFGFQVPQSPPWHRARLERFWGAYGNGGQRLWLLPGIDLVIAITAGNYDTPDQGMPPLRVLREVVLGSVG
ncbi:MAG: serine hydrolase [Enhydrobacter sp.]|nr:MAG: serine hydrolase [Enhydrobacter sp.]